MSLLASTNFRTRTHVNGLEIATIIGIASVWLSLFKRILYPALYAHYGTGIDQGIFAQQIYAGVLVAVVLILGLARQRSAALLLNHVWPIMISGVCGCLSMCLLTLDTAAQPSLTLISSALSALYLPIHIAFWILYLINRSSRSIMRTTLCSFAFFLFIFFALTILGLQSIYASAIYPLISTAAALTCRHQAAATTSEAHVFPIANPIRTQEAADAPEPQQSAAKPDPAPAQASPAILDQNKVLTGAARHTAPNSPDQLAAFGKAFRLSEREVELAAYAYRNYSAKRIATELFIAESTVYTHLKRIYRKTDVHSKQELITLIDTWKESAARLPSSNDEP